MYLWHFPILRTQSFFVANVYGPWPSNLGVLNDENELFIELFVGQGVAVGLMALGALVGSDPLAEWFRLP